MATDLDTEDMNHYLVLYTVVPKYFQNQCLLGLLPPPYSKRWFSFRGSAVAAVQQFQQSRPFDANASIVLKACFSYLGTFHYGTTLATDDRCPYLYPVHGSYPARYHFKKDLPMRQVDEDGNLLVECMFVEPGDESR